MRWGARRDMGQEQRARVAEAFRALRKEGFIARANYLCCGGCASYALATDVGALPPARRAKVLGAVTYHRQATERSKRGGALHLAYGQVEVDGVGTYGWPTVEVGRAVVAALRDAGLAPVWDGSPDSTIVVPGEGR